MDAVFWLEISAFITLMGLSAFFSSSETSLFSLDKVQLDQMRRDQHPRVDLIGRLLARPRRLIVTILIGNEFVNVAASVISAAIVIRFFGSDSKFINLFVMVPILLLVGEITPKTMAMRNNVRFASWQCRPLELFARGIAPVRWTVRIVSDFFITLLVGKERSRANIVTEDLVRTLTREAVGEGVLDRSEARYIQQILDFGNKTAADVLTVRADIFYLDIETSVDEAIRQIKETRHTKIPVFEGDRDHVVGILHSRDLLNTDLEGLAKEGNWMESLLREPYFVPETKAALQLFRALRKRRMSIAITVDEFGGVTGLVSTEDLLECIFGSIPSPSERVDLPEFTQLSDGRHAVGGRTTVEQFNTRLSASLSDGGAETIGGMLLNAAGELPTKGATVRIGDWDFTIDRVHQHRIDRVIVSAAADNEPPEGTT